MHITVYCPRCRSRYQLDPAMRGQRMRCPNTICREVFEVREEVDAPAVLETSQRPERSTPRPDQAVEPPASTYQTGMVGTDIPLVPIEEEDLATPAVEKDDPTEVIALLPAELARQPRTELPREERSWSEPPPVRRAAKSPTTESASPPEVERPARRPAKPPRGEGRKPRGDSVAAEDPATVVLKHDPTPAAAEPVEHSWEPPPVRRAEVRPTQSPAPSESTTAVAAPAEAGSQRRRVSSLIALAMVLLAVGLLGGGAWFIWSQFVATEARQLAEAQREYEEGKFASAGQKFGQLAKAYPKSESVSRYRFFSRLCEVRNDAQSLVEPREALERLEGFEQTYQHDPLLQEYRVDLWETANKLVDALIEKAREEKRQPLLDRARQLLAMADRYRPKDVAPTRRQQAEAAIAQVVALLAKLEERAQLLGQAKTLEATLPNLKLLRELLERHGLKQDPDFKALLVKMEEALRLQVRYVEQQAVIQPPEEPFEPYLMVAPLVASPRVPLTADGRVALALVRGVLYALDQGSGRVHWAMRVGIDTAALPVRLPATASSPEIFLVLSAERNTLRAVVAGSGESLWEHRLSAPCLGRPVIIQRRVYVPTVAGRVEELEIIQGHQLGYFELPPQRLTVGGVWQTETDWLYVPGDSQTVYVLDVARKQCVATLNTGHPAGSLRAAPVLVNRVDPAQRDNPENAVPPAYLILNQADGLGGMKLRVFEVNPEQKAALPALTPEPHVRGWSWFPAYQDGEKLAFVTDVGLLGVYGINQVRNIDKALFPELKDEFQLGQESARPQRAQVVHAVENDFWVLANGQLQRLHLNRFAQKVEPVWSKPLLLGSPLHEAQVDETGKTLFVVTRAEHSQTCFATAVRAADGEILWQRQLGVECPSEPVSAGATVVALDQGGGVFVFQPTRQRDLAAVDWLLGGQLVAPPVDEGLRWQQAVVERENGSVLVIGAAASGRRLLLRRYRPDLKDQQAQVTEERVDLRAPLAGPPAVGVDRVLLPLADGSLYRILLATPRTGGRTGPDWRSERAEDDAVGFVTWLNADDFLTTDGLRTVRRWRWPAGDVEWKKEVVRRELPARIVSTPLVLENDQICVADALGGLHVLQGPQLKPLRSWPLEGAITAGPFLRGGRIGCVVDRRRLVWLDPAEKQPLWEHTIPGEAVVGQPQLVGGHLLVADLSGRLVALDPATGRPTGPGYSLKANVAPSTAPVAYGPRHALVPLTDGTLFLLPLSQLGVRVIEWPWVW